MGDSWYIWDHLKGNAESISSVWASHHYAVTAAALNLPGPGAKDTHIKNINERAFSLPFFCSGMNEFSFDEIRDNQKSKQFNPLLFTSECLMVKRIQVIFGK